MIRFVQGDILQASAEALVNTVNCVGVMGRGIALQFKNVFPANFRAYEAACQRKEVQPGHMFVFDTGELTLPRYIINFPTKRHWRGKSRIEDIQAGLAALVDGYWLQALIYPKNFKSKQAVQSCLTWLRQAVENAPKQGRSA